ncbi:MAG: twin-arginine translocase TatA/TatE family subunit [Thermodesulfovibrionales bacterium]|jgi:sec-independent protein translocase protein TatA
MIGTQDLIIVAVIVVVLFGARKLPELGKGLGQTIRDFKKAMNEPDTIDVKPKEDSSKKEVSEKQEGDSKTV